MNKERLIKFVYILLRERLTFGDLEAILDEAEAEGETGASVSVQLYVEEIVSRLIKSGQKCYDNMCNTQDDDVRLVEAISAGMSLTNNATLVHGCIPMCADCRRRHPHSVVVEN